MKATSIIISLGAAMLPLLATSCTSAPHTEVDGNSFTRYVDPRIGTGGHGHVFYGANVPFGMVQVGPTSIPQEWDWCSGYHISDSTVIGFPHTHLSGTGIGDLHDVTLMPVNGTVTYARGHEDDPHSGLWSYSDRSRETARPGYYATRLTRHGIDVELTATERVGFHKYTFSDPDSTAVVIDLQNGGGWDRATEAAVKRIGDTLLAGYRYSRGWAGSQRIYFVAEFSQPITSLEMAADGNIAIADSCSGTVVYARANINAAPGNPVYVKVALSPVSTANALLNLKTELPGWDFDQCVAQADGAWNSQLRKIEISTSDADRRKIFYTALYHTMIAPSLFCDVNGDYRGADGMVHNSSLFKAHTTFSCWDTYRAAHPLMSIIHPQLTHDIVGTFLSIYDQQGKLPVWHLMGCETNTMVGNPGICILADAATKGYAPDISRAYDALRQSAMLDERGIGLRKRYGYIPCDKMKESVAYDMEYAIADWSVAQVAKMAGDTAGYAYFDNRSHSYRQLFDPATRFMRGKDSDGKFRTPFNPIASDHRNDDYCEGNAWQYTFLVPHDLPGLVGCFPSHGEFLGKLDSLFTVSSQLEGAVISPDISGMIGQYAHGNEPSHHITYFYTMLGQPWKTADRVRQILDTLYTSQPDGLCGNEDVGAMSAWYVLSALGFYQVEPAGGRYYFGSPLFDGATIKVTGGEFAITVHNNSASNRYIQKVCLNGQPYGKAYLDFADIAAGGSLEITMGNKHTKWY